MIQNIPPSRKNTGDGDDKWNRQQEMTAVLLAVMDIRGHGDAILPIGNEGQHMDNIVNWLSICFVKGGKGDVVACGIQFKRQNATIYFCNNEIQSKSDDTEIATEFQSLTQLAITALSTNSSLGQVRESFLMAIGSRAWDLILVKKKNLSSDNDTYSCSVLTDHQVEIALGQWATYKEGSMTNQDLEDTKAQVKSNIRRLIKLKLDASFSKDKRRLKIKVIAYLAIQVLDSAFMHEVTGKAYENALENTEDLAFLKRLYRRLWRLSRFYTGLDGFLNGLSELYKQTEQKPGDTFATFKVQFVWIQQFINIDVRSGYSESIAIKEPQYMAYIQAVGRKVLLDCKDESKGDKTALQLAIQGAQVSFRKAKITSIVDGVYTFQCTPKYHCETQLAQFFIHKNISQRTIGCSKLKCWSCNVFLKQIEVPPAAVRVGRSQFGAWKLSGTSAKSHFAWRIPDKPLFKGMSEDLWRTVVVAGSATFQAAKDELYNVLKDIYLNGGGPKPGDPGVTRFKHKRNRSFGSDSSTGSNWPVPVQQIVFDEETINSARLEEI